MALFKMTSMGKQDASAPAKNKHGGKRAGAGRKRRRYRRLDAPHRSREVFSEPSPVHVTLRGRRHISDMRIERVYRLISKVLERYRRDEWADFRVVHFSLQDTHLHLIVEAANDKALRRGMRSFAINSARAINKAFGGSGSVWFRYHSSVIKTRRYARSCIAYVLGNWRRHYADIENGQLVSAILDRFSSAISFSGWTKRFRVPAGYQPLPVSVPSTWLMREGWRYAGPLEPYQAPGPAWR